MRIVLLASASSIHTIRWANGLSDAGVEVHLISQHPLTEALDERVKLYSFPFRGVIGYFSMVKGVRRLVRQIRPDLLNAHYASGYGTTARLVGFRPWILSVWGSDIYLFPKKSPLHFLGVKLNLLSADMVASTSLCMAEEARKVAPHIKYIEITPFGVDLDAYAELQPMRSRRLDSERLVLGTIKSMRPIYGIDVLIKSFAIVYRRLAVENAGDAEALRLRLIGDGPVTGELMALAKRLGIIDKVQFLGRVPHNDVPRELDDLDVYIALSHSESFGVAVLEAGAAGRPVVVSDAGGLPEVVIDGVTGLVVPRNDPDAAAEAILKLIKDADLRIRLGEAGRHHVEENYSWPVCIEKMLTVYQKMLMHIH